MPTPSPRISYPWSPSWRRRRVASTGRGASLSGQDRRGGGRDLVVDFCSPPSSSSRRRLLLRRREGGGRSTGVSAVDLSEVAAGCLDACSVLGLWWLAGGSGDAPRPRRREAPDPEVEGKLGAVPRPTIHSDMWAPLVLLLAVHKAHVAMELLQLRVLWSPSFFLAVSVGAGGERLFGLGGAVNPRGLCVIWSFFWGFLLVVRIYVSYVAVSECVYVFCTVFDYDLIYVCI